MTPQVKRMKKYVQGLKDYLNKEHSKHSTEQLASIGFEIENTNNWIEEQEWTVREATQTFKFF